MYRIEFYEKRNGTSDVWNFLEELREKSKTNKDARIQYDQIIFYIDLLARNGTRLPSKITKYLEDDIGELRPGNNRIFYFYYEDGQYVLLHHFRKTSMKTPPRELARAKEARNDYLRQQKERRK